MYKISRTSEFEAKKRDGHPHRRYRPKVRIDGGCYTNQPGTVVGGETPSGTPIFKYYS